MKIKKKKKFKLKNLKWKIIIKIIKKIPYDSRQKCFTTYPNFQEFVNAKKVICKCGQIISLGVNYQVFGQSYYVLWKMWARTFMGRKASRILDHLSYISIKAYLPVSQRYFSCENLAGRDITIHITPWEVVIFWGHAHIPMWILIWF